MLPTNPAALDELLARTDGLVLSFTESACRVGEAVQPKLEARLAAEFPRLSLVVLQRDAAPELAAHLGVFVVPTVIVFFAGRESSRFVRTFAIDQVAEAIARPYAMLFGAT